MSEQQHAADTRDDFPGRGARADRDGAVAPHRAHRARAHRRRPNGRVVARPVVAQADVPPFTRAAMDGYAVRAADTVGASTHDPADARPGSRRCSRARCRQGPSDRSSAPRSRPARRCPAGADAVVMVEETEKRRRRTVRVFSPVYPGSERRPGRAPTSGSASRCSRPATCSTRAASARSPRSACSRSRSTRGPASAILSTGNEVVDPGQPLEPGQIYDINKFTLSSDPPRARRRARCPTRRRPTPCPTWTRALEACLAEDVVLFSGGSSVGERDLILDVVERMGEVLFHGIAVKPGKPTLFGMIAGTPVFGMPGYPTSCLSNAYMLLVAPLRTLARLPAWAPRIVRSRSASASCRRRAGTSSTRCGSWTARRCRHSRRRATSPACRRPTATSRSRRRSMSSKRANSSTSGSSEQSGGSRQSRITPMPRDPKARR